MSFPLVPLPSFLINWYPGLQILHEACAIAFAISLGFFGLLLIAIWGTSNPNDILPWGGTVRDRLQWAYLLSGLSVVVCIFGSYLVGLFALGILAYFARVLTVSAKAVFFQRPKQD